MRANRDSCVLQNPCALLYFYFREKKEVCGLSRNAVSQCFVNATSISSCGEKQCEVDSYS